MCFTNDYEWCADIVEYSGMIFDTTKKCQECWREFPSGYDFYHIYMQQHEWCRACDDGMCDCVGDCCECENPDYGETFETWHCDDCHRFLEAVEEAEVESGCKISEARPAYMEMCESISNAGPDEARKYWVKAMELHPDMEDYLVWLWQKLFGDEHNNAEWFQSVLGY